MDSQWIDPTHAPLERRAGRAWLAWVLAFVAALVPLWHNRAYLDGDAVVYRADAAQLQFPRYVSLCESLQRGDFPLWQTLLYGGSPFHANPENPTQYPLTLLVARFATPLWTINLTIVVHLVWAALGMYLLARRLAHRCDLGEGPTHVAALVAAVCFSLNNFTRRDHINLVAYGAAHAWIPWTLLAAERLTHTDRPRRAAALLALCVAALLSTGGLYVIPYALLALAIWTAGLGMEGNARARLRTLVFGGLAALCAVLLMAPKLLPYLEWLPSTNRLGRLPLEVARGVPLGGPGPQATWVEAWTRTLNFLGGLGVLWPAAFGLCLVRERSVRLVWACLGLGLAIAMGGWTWRLFYEFVPPFDQIRNASRAWTLVNAFFPLAAGLGAAWLVSRWELARRRAWVGAAAGLAIAVSLAWFLTGNDPRAALLDRPDSLRELRDLYPRWTDVAQRAGRSWRVAKLDRREPNGRNEQFITALLGVETVAGYQGHVWPRRLAHFLYGETPEEIAREERLKRLGSLSVRWLVESEEGAEVGADPRLTEPPGIEGTREFENEDARPRFSVPAVALGLLADEGCELDVELLSRAGFPLRDATILRVSDREAVDGSPWSDDEWKALDLLLVARGRTPPIGMPETLERIDFEPQSDSQSRVALLDALVERVAALARVRRSLELGLERDGANRTRLHVLGVDEGSGTPRARFAVASEPWSWYPGWTIEGMPRAPALRVADYVSSAFLLPAHSPVSPLIARYHPASNRRGLWICALGAATVLALLVLPAARSQRGA